MKINKKMQDGQNKDFVSRFISSQPRSKRYLFKTINANISDNKVFEKLEARKLIIRNVV